MTATEALEALQQLKSAEALFKHGDYGPALQVYSQLIQEHPDLALTEYARLGQALCMYQVRVHVRIHVIEDVCVWLTISMSWCSITCLI